MARQNIVIIGAGLIGCMLGRLLALRGHRVTIYEKREDPEKSSIISGRSTHLVISVRGWKALNAIGAAESILPHTIALAGRRVHTVGGEEIFQPYGESDQYIHSIHRNTLNRELLRLCSQTNGVNIQFNTQFGSVKVNTGEIQLEELTRGTIFCTKADRVFAADGAFSTVRSQLVEEGSVTESKEHYPYGYKELTISKEHTSKLKQDAMHAWPRGPISLFAFPNSDGSFTATLLAQIEGKEGFSTLSQIDVVEESLRHRFDDIDLESVTKQVIENPLSTLVSIRCNPWSVNRRVVLIGDSAHAMVPFLGQGMNAGFEDCTTLVGLLDSNNQDFDKALELYEPQRRENCDAITTLSSLTFNELTEHVADPEFHLLKKVERKLYQMYPSKFIPTYQLIAFTHIPYSSAMDRIRRLGTISRKIVRQMGINEGTSDASLETHIQRFFHNSTKDLKYEA